MPTDFTLPELGENIATGDVLRVLVKAGDTVAKDQAVLELETDKATIEVPSSVAGVVKEIKVKAGDKVKVGQPILSLDDSGAVPPKQTDTEAEPAKAGAAPSKQPDAKAETAKADTVPPTQADAKAEPARADAGAARPAAGVATADVGSATPADAAAAPAAKPAAQKVPDMQPDVQAQVQPTSSDKAGVKAEEPASETPSRGRKVVDISRGARQVEPASAPEMPPAPAAPSVRRMARELGVEIDEVAGSGPSGRISIEDVKEHAKHLVVGAARGENVRATPLPDFSRWGEVERQPLRAVRRKTAEHLSAAWATIPHVTQHDLADITALEALRQRYAKQVETGGGALTIAAIAVKVVAAALKVFPQFNASIDMGAEELILKKYVHIGVAVDTDRGLLVPVIRDADTKNITELAIELSELAEKARRRKLALEEMQGGSFSISNLGGIGGSFFTPIVNAPEVAILGISRARMEPVYKDGQFVPRLMLPLSLSYDHRVIDGADGIRFLRWIIEALEQPFLLALEG
ncbi:MAG: 2-oxo acid dehydrogenase subunit E2 [Acidobacteria bacterium]|nr:2-oxo acid dehydrogenase subunit E2 [Acidobacteriota bacterium]